MQAKASTTEQSTSQILFEDKNLLIYNKPVGIPCENEKFQFLKRGVFFELVHRLDRDTSGVLVFAKTQQAFEGMLSLFKERQVSKEYLAIVDGVPKQDQGLIDNFLGEIQRFQGQTIWEKYISQKV